MAEQIGVLEIALGVDLGEMISELSKGQQIVAGFVAGVTELANKAIEAAAEAQTAAAKVAGVFGKLAPEVSEFSEHLGQAAGRAGSDIEGMVATFGAMVSPMLKNKEVAAQMSEGLTSMAVNLSKAAHISADEAMGALQGGLAGHGRALAMLGIQLNATSLQAQATMDHLGNMKGLSRAQQEMIAYQVIMAQQGQVATRAAAASGTYDEAQARLEAHTKELAEAFGADLLPGASAALGVMSSLVGVFSSMSPQVRAGVEAVTALAVVIGAAATASALLGTSLGEAGIEAAMAWVEALGPALVFIGALAALGASVVLLVGSIRSNWGALKYETQALAQSIQDAFKPVLDWLTRAFQAVWQGIKDGAALVTNVVFAILEGLMGGIQKVFQVIGSATGAGWAKSAAASAGGANDAMESGRQSLVSGQAAQKAGELLSSAAGAAGGSLSRAAEAAGDALKSAGSWTATTFRSGLEGILGMFTGSEGGAGPHVADLTRGDIKGEAGKKKGTPQVALQNTMSFYDEQDANLQVVMDAQDAATKKAVEAWANQAEKMQSEAAAAGRALQESLIGSMGDLGKFVNGAIKAAESADPMAALAQLAVQLLESSTQGQEAMNVLSTIFKMFAQTVGQLLGDILPILGTLQNILAPVLRALGVVFAALGPGFSAIGTLLQTVIGPQLQLLGTIIQALAPVFQVVSLVLQGVTAVVIGIFLGLASLWNVFAGVISGIVNGIIAVINFFISAIDAALGWLGVNINQLSQVNLSIDTSGLQQSLHDLTDATGAQTVASDQAAASLTNLPTGYKIALREYQNENLAQGAAGGVPQFASGGYISKTGIALIHEGEYVIPPGGLSAGGGAAPSGGAGGAGITINATIVSNDPQDIWTKLQTVMNRALAAKGRSNIAGVGRFALPSDAR